MGKLPLRFEALPPARLTSTAGYLELELVRKTQIWWVPFGPQKSAHENEGFKAYIYIYGLYPMKIKVCGFVKVVSMIFLISRYPSLGK